MNRQAQLKAVANSQPLPLNLPDDEPLSGEMDIDLRAIWSIIYRNRRVIIAALAVALTLGIIVTFLTTRIYQASASVQIEQQATKVLSTEDDEPMPSAGEGDRFLQTQTDLLQSRALAIQVMESLRLLKDDNFFVRMKEEPVEKPRGTLSLAETRREAVIKILLTNLKVDLARNSRIADVSFKSPDPVLAAQIANSFVHNYIVFSLQRRFATSAYARDFLQKQLLDTKQKLEESERLMIDYARSAKLIDTSTGMSSTAVGQTNGPRSLTTSNLVALNSAYTAARTARLEAEQRYLQAMRTPLTSLSEVMANPAYQQLIQQRSLAQAAYDEESQRRRPGFPTMQQAAAQLASLDVQATKIAISVRAGLRDVYLTALGQERELARSVEGLKTDTLAEQDRSIRYNILKRETDTNRTMYDGLLQRFKEISAASGLTANNISVVDSATTPTVPVSPNSLFNLLAAAVIGFVAAAVIIFVREKFDDVIRSPEDVSRKLGLPFLNSIPLLVANETVEEALAKPRSPLSEAYFALQTSIELVAANGMPRSLLLTSSRASEGKSTTALAIARNFASLGRNVLLIDGDLRKPSLHRQLVLVNNSGLASVLARFRSPEEVIQKTAFPNLDFISSGPLPPNPAGLLSGPRLPELMIFLEERYDVVVIDGPPVLGLADAVLLSNAVAGTIFVVEASGSHFGHVKSAVRRLIMSGSNVIGAVLTKFDARKIGYGDEHGYYYYSYGSETVVHQTR